MLTAIAIVIVVLIAAVLLFAATRPDTFRIEHSASIKAPPEGEGIRLDQRFPQLRRLVAVGEEGPRDEAEARRHGDRQGRAARVAGQQGRRPGAHGNHGIHATIQGRDPTGLHQAL